MLNILRRGGHVFQPEACAPGWKPDPDVVWIDLYRPTREEELIVEAALGLDLPTKEEMEAIEPSSRFYQESGATFMTTAVLAHSQDQVPIVSPVTFVLTKNVLVTLRTEELRAFAVYSTQAHEFGAGNGVGVFFGLMDAVVQRLADVLQRVSDDVENCSTSIFRRPSAGNFRPLLTALARAQSVTSLTRNSLVSITRLLSYAAIAPEMGLAPDHRTRLESLHVDVQSLTEHSAFLSTHVGFLLDAALGLINIEQNGIIKFFSVVAVVFLPPTLVASIYGMNFDVMPELHWVNGYPMALGMMVLSAVLPILWFKQRGWL